MHRDEWCKRSEAPGGIDDGGRKPRDGDDDHHQGHSDEIPVAKPGTEGRVALAGDGGVSQCLSLIHI